MFKPFKLFDRSGSTKSGSSLGAIGVNSKLGPSAKQYKSLIFNSASSQFLSRTPLVAGNRKTFTWSGWVKRSKVATGTFYQLFGGGPVSGANDGLFFDTGSGGIYYTHTATSPEWIVTSSVYRDPSAWYHITLSVDTTQAIAVNRIKIFVNGIQNLDFSYQNLTALNSDSAYINSTNPHRIGAHTNNSSYNFDGYLSEINFIDGQALGPENFGYFDSIGIWQPKRYSGLYGTNGFYLPLNDSSFSELIKDKSGNGNNWTLNGYSSSLINNVVVSDSPVNNYCTLDPLSLQGGSLSNGNLNGSTGGVAPSGGGFGTFAIPATGKWYWEFMPNDGNGFDSYSGISASPALSSPSVRVVYYGFSGDKEVDGVTTAYGSTYGQNDIIGVAVNSDSGVVTFYKNGVSQGNITYSISGRTLHPWFADGSSVRNTSFVFNFGQRSFAYAPPTGFKSLCTANLPVPAIANGKNAMDVISYIGGNSVYASDSFGSYIKLAMPLNANETIYDISTQLSNNISTVKISTNSNTTFPTTSPANTKFYTGSAYFDNVGADRITIPNNNDFKFGTGDFTVELYFRFENVLSSTKVLVKCADNNSFATGWVCGTYNGAMSFYNGAGTYYYGSTALTTGVWYHLAWTRQNGTLRQFINGVLEKSDTVTTALDPTASLSIGNDISSTWHVNGWMQDLKVYKGVAKYTSSFTVPTAMVTTENSGTTKTVTGLNFSPDLVWIKSRTDTTDHAIYDSVRPNLQRRLETNNTDAEPVSNDDGITSLNSGGFTLGSLAQVNTKGSNYIAWAWDADSSNVTNTSGSITSTVRADATKGFSIVSYTGTGVNATVGHGLGVAPKMIITKKRSSSGDWRIYHVSIGNTNILEFTTAASIANLGSWNNTSPTSSVFSVGNSIAVNESGSTMIAYCFSEIEGYSKFGSYTGNGSADGPFVWCGFRPRYVMVKNASDAATNWIVSDAVRTAYNDDASEALYPNTADYESLLGGTTENRIDFLANGFKVRSSNGSFNASTKTLIFVAFAEHPFKYSRAR